MLATRPAQNSKYLEENSSNNRTLSQTHSRDLDEIRLRSLWEYDLFCPMYRSQRQLQAVFE